MSVAVQPISLVEFLQLPETEPTSEYIDGKVVRKMSPKARHSRLQWLITQALNNHVRCLQLGEAFPELRCTFAGRSHVYDIAYFRADRIAYGPDGQLVDDVFLPPDLAVEILSPGQSSRGAEDKLRWSVRHGVRLGAFIDPYRYRVRLFEPGARTRTLAEKDSLDGKQVIPGFRLAVKTIFGWLRREAN